MVRALCRVQYLKKCIAQRRVLGGKSARARVPHLGVSTTGGTPIAGWFRRENPTINGWFRGTPIYGNPHLDGDTMVSIDFPANKNELFFLLARYHMICIISIVCGITSSTEDPLYLRLTNTEMIPQRLPFSKLGLKYGHNEWAEQKERWATYQGDSGSLDADQHVLRQGVSRSMPYHRHEPNFLFCFPCFIPV